MTPGRLYPQQPAYDICKKCGFHGTAGDGLCRPCWIDANMMACAVCREDIYRGDALWYGEEETEASCVECFAHRVIYQSDGNNGEPTTGPLTLRFMLYRIAKGFRYGDTRIDYYGFVKMGNLLVLLLYGWWAGEFLWSVSPAVEALQFLWTVPFYFCIIAMEASGRRWVTGRIVRGCDEVWTVWLASAVCSCLKAFIYWYAGFCGKGPTTGLKLFVHHLFLLTDYTYLGHTPTLFRDRLKASLIDRISVATPDIPPDTVLAFLEKA